MEAFMPNGQDDPVESELLNLEEADGELFKLSEGVDEEDDKDEENEEENVKPPSLHDNEVADLPSKNGAGARSSAHEKSLSLAVRYLVVLDDAHLILASKIATESLKLVCDHVGKGLRFKFLRFILEQNFHSVVIKLLNYLNDNYLAVFSARFGRPENVIGVDELKSLFNKFLLMRRILFMVMRLSNHSAMFCTKYMEAGGLEGLVDMCKMDVLVEALMNGKRLFDPDNQLHVKTRAVLKRIFRILIGDLHNLSKYSDKYKQQWIGLKVFDTVMDISERINKKKYITVIHMIMAYIAEDDQINQLPKLQEVVKEIVRLIQKTANKLKANAKPKLERHRFQLNDSQEGQKLIFWISDGNICWNLVELVESLYHLAVNDRIKHEIYFEQKVNEYLRVFIYNGNNTERTYSIKLLWQLCFDVRVADDVYNDKELYDFIHCLVDDCERGEKTDEDLLSNCRGIDWLLNQKFTEKTREVGIPPGPPDDPSKPGDVVIKEGLDFPTKTEEQIMISYNRDNRDLCMAIKKELVDIGYKVWIDVESIHGSSLESMAKAIEGSFCVLICMTEKYKKSPNCRAEAEYAFQLNKFIVPLIMQENYKPDGWLGIILGSKIFVNFTRYSFEECIRRLKHELDHFNCNSSRRVDTTLVEAARKTGAVPDSAQEDTKATAIVAFNEHVSIQATGSSLSSEADVEAWFREKGLSLQILDSLKPCDGRVLVQLAQILQRAPEFFYHSLASNAASVSLREITLFTYELNELFKSK